MSEDRIGYKRKGGGLASKATLDSIRADRIKQLSAGGSAGTADQFMVNAGPGRFQCRLCYSFHLTEESYVTHSRGRKHLLLVRNTLKKPHIQSNSGQRPSLETKKAKTLPTRTPEWEIAKVYDRRLRSKGLLVHCKFDGVSRGAYPSYKFLSMYEQNSVPITSPCQYLVIAAPRYKNIGIRLPLEPVMLAQTWTSFCRDTGDFYIQFFWETKSSEN